MLDQLINMVKEEGQSVVANHPEIPGDRKTAVLEEAGTAIAGTLQNAVSNGQTDEVQQLFGSNSTDVAQANPLVQKTQTSFIDSITSKLGFDKSAAMGIAASLIPMLLSKLVQRGKSGTAGNSGFDLSTLISSLAGGAVGSGGGLGNVLGQITSMQNGGGGFSLQEVVNQASGGDEEKKEQNSMEDAAKGFFK